MSFPRDDNELDKALADAFGPSPVAGFDAWQQQHSQALAFLNPQRINALARKRRILNRIIIFSAAAAVLACIFLGVANFGTNGAGASSAFAQVLEQIQKAKTITWKTNFYEHITSKDGKRTWANIEVIEKAYKAPGLYREVRLDEKGKVERVEIKDYIHGRKLTYSPKEKKAKLEELAPVSHVSGPFAFVKEKLNAPNLQWVGKRKTATGEVNVFRTTSRVYRAGERDWSEDFWIDANTKKLVATYTPGTDIYDPETDPARNNPPETERSNTTAICGGDFDIRYDVPLDDSLFRLEPPEGYTVELKQPDHITEKEMIDYLGIVANFNDKMFPDEAFTPWNLLSKINSAEKKPREEMTAAERKLLDTDMRYALRFGGATNIPIVEFFTDPDSIVENSFRYLGKGVKLGEKDRIVCWYKLKDQKTYRVVYGDLSVKDVAPEDLPLPVEP